MHDSTAQFWLGLLSLGGDAEHRARLWNAYLGQHLPARTQREPQPGSGWPTAFIPPPADGWPTMTPEEEASIEELARDSGGHPVFGYSFMNFQGYSFSDSVDLSGLTLIYANFDNAAFEAEVSLSSDTRFLHDCSFRGVRFMDRVSAWGPHFLCPVDFVNSIFEGPAWFHSVTFEGGASFNHVVFKEQVSLNDSRFEQLYYSSAMMPLYLADFRYAKFEGRARFHRTVFGSDPEVHSRQLTPGRNADFTGATFERPTEFQKATFVGPPAFFATDLHEDTNFSSVEWGEGTTDRGRLRYAIRAWERLELLMSDLEKPLDRHRFFRLKMRARRKEESALIRTLNWLFETIADYGWGVRRAVYAWAVLWLGGGVLFSGSVAASGDNGNWRDWLIAGLATSFSNAHAFLGLADEGGYLAEFRTVVENNDGWGVVNSIGVLQVVLGPIFLFFVLLTMRNRFRLGG
ncbi:MAG: pentapeptide repeat-containing protein [Gemmatimonadales bacterium]|nr:pentapeptide repeat-containing protein [Candidatus Palauibacter irciniicola]MYC19472.1 pentapeptide repeat-containing protein [Gemmatimonadales bacterium]